MFVLIPENRERFPFERKCIPEKPKTLICRKKEIYLRLAITTYKKRNKMVKISVD